LIKKEVRDVTKLVKFFKDEEGVVMIEYALIAALIGVALIVTLGLVTGALQSIFTRIITALNGA
jgi:pilus assembly protein Flp/PilA